MAQYKGAASEGSRAMQLMKKREKEAKELEYRKKKIEEDLRVDKMDKKFTVHYDAVEAQLKVKFHVYSISIKSLYLIAKINFVTPVRSKVYSTWNFIMRIF